MKIKIIKSNSLDPAWTKYVGKEYDATKILGPSLRNKIVYQLKDGSCWLPEEVEILEDK